MTPITAALPSGSKTPTADRTPPTTRKLTEVQIQRVALGILATVCTLTACGFTAVVISGIAPPVAPLVITIAIATLSAAAAIACITLLIMDICNRTDYQSTKTKEKFREYSFEELIPHLEKIQKNGTLTADEIRNSFDKATFENFFPHLEDIFKYTELTPDEIRTKFIECLNDKNIDQFRNIYSNNLNLVNHKIITDDEHQTLRAFLGELTQAQITKANAYTAANSEFPFRKRKILADIASEKSQAESAAREMIHQATQRATAQFDTTHHLPYDAPYADRCRLDSDRSLAIRTARSDAWSTSNRIKQDRCDLAETKRSSAGHPIAIQQQTQYDAATQVADEIYNASRDDINYRFIEYKQAQF